MRNYFTLLLILTALSFSACEKGLDGAEGAPGAKGEQGLKGADGSTIHSGTGAPANTLGNIGDFYLDKNTSEFYGPKTATGWPTAISLKGNTGATGSTGTAGTPGSKILSGTTAPALSVGTEGDFYFDTVNLAFYGPKTASSWGSAISLKASNSVTTLLYNNQKFDVVYLENSYLNTYETPNFYTYSFNGLKTINITNPAYQNAYSTGIIFVRLKETNNSNSVWANNINKYEWTSNSNHNEWYIGDDDEGPESHPDKIVIEGNQYTTTDPNGNQLKNLKFDVKVVCIPAGTVLQMSAKNIDVEDAKAVAKYLNL